MTQTPQPQPGSRATRVRPAEITAAVLRFPNGGRTTGRLEVISLTGGLLWLPKLVDRGSRVKVMFLTDAGPVLGAAEMLRPLSWTQQPFRFVGLHRDDRRRLCTITHSSLVEVPVEVEVAETGGAEDWIEKYRAALPRQNPSRKRLFKGFFGSVAIALLGLGSALYVFSDHLPK